MHNGVWNFHEKRMLKPDLIQNKFSLTASYKAKSFISVIMMKPSQHLTA